MLVSVSDNLKEIFPRTHKATILKIPALQCRLALIGCIDFRGGNMLCRDDVIDGYDDAISLMVVG